MRFIFGNPPVVQTSSALAGGWRQIPAFGAKGIQNYGLILILFAPLSAETRADLGFLAFFNRATSGGDLVNFGWIITHLPLHATVKGNGWGLLWKIK